MTTLSSSRRLVTLASASILVASATIFGALPAHAAPAGPGPSSDKSSYAALGDSYAAGQGAGVPLDETMARVRQEVTLHGMRIDVEEELDRLRSHVVELRRILAGPGPVGKRMDFLMQEFNREANTLGSKSVDAELSQVSLELKVLIEQMREQVQNLE